MQKEIIIFYSYQKRAGDIINKKLKLHLKNLNIKEEHGKTLKNMLKNFLIK